MMKIEGVVVLLSFFIVCQAACPDTYKSAWVRTVGMMNTFRLIK